MRDNGEGSQDLETEVKRVCVVDHQTKHDKTISTAVPFYKLFSFADSIDKILMIVGSIGAIGNALCMPIATILYGELVDSFDQTQTKLLVSVVSKVPIFFFFFCSVNI